MFMLLVTSMCYGGLHMLARQSGVLRETGSAEIFWKLSCSLLIALEPFALAVWGSLKMWRRSRRAFAAQPDNEHCLRCLWGHRTSGLHSAETILLVEIVLVIAYIDPALYQELSFHSY